MSYGGRKKYTGTLDGLRNGCGGFTKDVYTNGVSKKHRFIRFKRDLSRIDLNLMPSTTLGVICEGEIYIVYLGVLEKGQLVLADCITSFQEPWYGAFDKSFIANEPADTIGYLANGAKIPIDGYTEFDFKKRVDLSEVVLAIGGMFYDSILVEYSDDGYVWHILPSIERDTTDDAIHGSMTHTQVMINLYTGRLVRNKGSQFKHWRVRVVSKLKLRSYALRAIIHLDLIFDGQYSSNLPTIAKKINIAYIPYGVPSYEIETYDHYLKTPVSAVFEYVNSASIPELRDGLTSTMELPTPNTPSGAMLEVKIFTTGGVPLLTELSTHTIYIDKSEDGYRWDRHASLGTLDTFTQSASPADRGTDYKLFTKSI